MSLILLVDDDPDTTGMFERVLSPRNHRIIAVSLGSTGLALARTEVPDIVFAELALPDISGLELLRQLYDDGASIPFVVISRHGTIRSAVEAIKLGAIDYLEKPLTEQHILSTTRAVLTVSQRAPELPAVKQWLPLLLGTLRASTDPSTLKHWSRLVHMAQSTLENRCLALGVAPKAALSFARMLRAIVLAPMAECRIDLLLEVDPRTLRRLRKAAGLPLASRSPRTIDYIDPVDYIDRQTFVTDPTVRRAIKCELASVLRQHRSASPANRVSMNPLTRGTGQRRRALADDGAA